MAGAHALQVAPGWMSEALDYSPKACRDFGNAVQACRARSAPLYRLRLSNTGLMLQRMHVMQLQLRIKLMTAACVNDSEEILWVLDQARTALNERRQRFLDLVAQNREANSPIHWAAIWDWSGEDAGEDPASNCEITLPALPQ